MKPRTDSIKTASALARRLGVSRQLISCHVRRPDAPAPRPDGTLDEDAWREYLAGAVRITASFSKADRRRLAALKLRILEAQALRLERANAIEAGRWINAVAWDNRKRVALGALFDELDRGFCHDLVPAQRRCADEAALQRLNREAIEKFRANLIKRLEMVDATPDDKLQ